MNRCTCRLEFGFKTLGSQRRLIRASLITVGAVLGWVGGSASAQVLDPCPVLADPLVFINPEVVETGKGLAISEEGCLSFPGVFVEIKRPRWAKIRAQNVEGESFEAEGDESVRIQVKGKRFRIPKNASLSIEHEAEGGKEELELQLRWTTTD